MKLILLLIISLILLAITWVSFIGFSDGVENVSSGNYFTPNDEREVDDILEKEFTIRISNDLYLHGDIRKVPFSARIAVTLKLTGTRNYSLCFGADPLPSQEDIASAVEEELIKLGLKSGIKLAVITLPLDRTEQDYDRMKPMKM